ncbi:MAG: hypothetical protein JWP01_3351 [Myxococcales bacterium]|nr:hypothetical protein [Myxococcales bacterium]
MSSCSGEPVHAINFIRAQSVEHGWLDEVWCEGGALVDLRRHELLFFGGEDIRYDPMRHRLMLALMHRTWPGWSVRWAFEGLGDLVDHLGIERDVVRSGRDRELVDPDRFEESHDRVFGVFSVHHPDGRVTLYTSIVAAPSLFNFQGGVVERLAALAGHGSLTLLLHGDGAPSSGAHLDLAARRIDLWEAGFHQDLQGQVWDGWRLVHHGAEFEAQLALAGGSLELLAPSRRTVLKEIGDALLRWSNLDPLALVDAFDQRTGGALQITPQFAGYASDDLPVEERARIFAWAAAGLPPVHGFSD